MILEISARQPFNLNSVIRSHGWIQLSPFETDAEFRTLRYVDRLTSGRLVTYLVEETDIGVSVMTEPDLDKIEQDEIVDKVTWMLGLDVNLTRFYDLARQEPKLAHVESAARGRVLRSPTLFEDVVKTIATTNVQWGGTKSMIRRLVNNFGHVHPKDPTLHSFPAPEVLAELHPDVIRNTAGFGYRSPYVCELAQRVATGELDLEAYKFNDLPSEDLRKQLLGIKGIGAYAAANLLMILGRYDYLPVDSWALKVVSQEWYNGEPVRPAQVESAFADWGEFKGLAYWFWDWSALG